MTPAFERLSDRLAESCSGGLDARIRIVSQRQSRNLPAIELFFERVTRFNWVPAPENYDSVILAATPLVENGAIFWSPEGDWRPENSDRDKVTWVSARRLRWREVNCLGEKLHYGPGE
jgi:hypothetical protein